MTNTEKIKKVQNTTRRVLAIIGGPSEFVFCKVAGIQPKNEDSYTDRRVSGPKITTTLKPQKMPEPTFYLELSDGNSYRVEQICVENLTTVESMTLMCAIWLGHLE